MKGKAKPCNLTSKILLACAKDETKLWLSPSAKRCRNPCSWPLPVYQELSTRHDWPVKKAIVDSTTTTTTTTSFICMSIKIKACFCCMSVLKGQFHGSANAHLSKCYFSARTCCIVYESNMIMSECCQRTNLHTPLAFTCT